MVLFSKTLKSVFNNLHFRPPKHHFKKYNSDKEKSQSYRKITQKMNILFLSAVFMMEEQVPSK